MTTMMMMIAITMMTTMTMQSKTPIPTVSSRVGSERNARPQEKARAEESAARFWAVTSTRYSMTTSTIKTCASSTNTNSAGRVSVARWGSILVTFLDGGDRTITSTTRTIATTCGEDKTDGERR